MKLELLTSIKNITDLLISCDLNQEARWFQEKGLVLSKLQPSSPEFKNTLKELEHILGGMGSFTDLRLHPKKESGLREKQVTKRQWELAEKLADLIQRGNDG